MLKFELRENYDELMGSFVKVLRKLDKHEAINLTDKNVKFLVLSLKSDDVNKAVANLVNYNYYGTESDMWIARKSLGEFLRVIRREPKEPEKIPEPNRHIRNYPTFDC